MGKAKHKAIKGSLSFVGSWGQIRGQRTFGLKTCAFIEVKKIFWWVETELNDMFHFRKEIRVSDPQEIFMQMRSEGMGFQNALNG